MYYDLALVNCFAELSDIILLLASIIMLLGI